MEEIDVEVEENNLETKEDPIEEVAFDNSFLPVYDDEKTVLEMVQTIDDAIEKDPFVAIDETRKAFENLDIETIQDDENVIENVVAFEKVENVLEEEN